MRASRKDPTLIGTVRHVMGATVTVQLLDDVAGSAALHHGRVYHIGQIGSLVVCPQGPLRLVGAVTLLGISELIAPPEPGLAPSQGERWLQVQMLGELDGLGRFNRGVSTFPSISDEVMFATSAELGAIYPTPTQGFIPLGCLSTSRTDTLRLDLGKLVNRHTAVVGSTGSGKSSTVARLVQSVLSEGNHRANVVVIDPHGEYGSAFGADAVRQSVSGVGRGQLSIPYWALGLDDFLSAFGGAGTVIGPVVRNKVQELILKERRRFLSEAGWTTPSIDDITVDTPVPFDIRSVWYELDFLNRATVLGAKNSKNWAVEDKGDPESLRGATFQPYHSGGQEPHQCTTYGHFNPLPDRIAVRLKDPRFAFLSRAIPDAAEPDPLHGCLSSWLGNECPVSVLDFGGVPSEAADVAIGAVLTLLTEVAMACPEDSGIGRSRPVWVVLEEAHRFIGDKVAGTAGAAKLAAERIAREGRKYGLGLMIVSQRPSELSETALSQCGTIVSMRLSNAGDQGRVKAALPDTVANLAEALPALRTGEALVVGEATTLPARVLVDMPSPAPQAADPSISTWLGEAEGNDVVAAVDSWRGKLEQEPQCDA